jgi:hypothetical protein
MIVIIKFHLQFTPNVGVGVATGVAVLLSRGDLVLVTLTFKDMFWTSSCNITYWHLAIIFIPI